MTERILNDRYALESKVGEGGMAVTYRARDLLLNRTVAVKLMREQFTSDPQFVERFRREAQAAARLSHENIASVYDTGRANGTHYIVMEFIEGTDLKQRLRRDGAVPVLTALEIGRQIAAALDAAHRGGLVHRDIKPHNILLNGDGKVKVTDFGIAKIASEGEDTGVIIGSVHYISPEQARGDATAPASDLYALGAVMFEMLTGRTVFEGENALAVAHKQIYEQPPLLRAIRPTVPPAVESMVLRCLEKDPRARYQSAAEVCAVMTQLLAQLSQEETVVIPAPAAPSPMDATMIYRQPETPAPRPARPAAAPVRAPQPPPRDEGGGVHWFVWVLVILLAGGLSYGGFLLFAPPPKPQNTMIAVPDLFGRTQEEAEAILQQRGFEKAPEIFKRENGAPEGTIYSQDPTAGTNISQDTTVLLWVSLGQLIVPDVSGMSQDAAKRQIRGIDFKGSFATPKKEASDMVPKGHVIRTEPAAGATLDRQGVVTLVMSSGPKPIEVKKITEEYKPGLTAEQICNDLGAATAYVRIMCGPADGELKKIWDNGGRPVRPGDPIPPQHFERPSDKQYKVQLLTGKDETSEFTTQEEQLFPPTMEAIPVPAEGAL